MTMCEKIQPRLTAYLDGELADEHGSIVRGHLRECAACRLVARDESLLRDGLRELPPVDPPASMWAGIQAKLAAAEVADAHRPAWRRAVDKLSPSRWSRWVPTMPQLAVGSMLAATAVVALTLRARHDVDDSGPSEPVATLPAPVAPPPTPAAHSDVTADLQAEPARITASYGQAVDELIKLADEARPGWSDDHKAAFDTRVAALRGEIAQAGAPRAQQKAERALIRYLQGAVVREDIVLASGGAR